MSECLYLGHVIGSGKVYPKNTNVKAIHEFKVPVTKLKDVRSFLGLPNIIGDSFQIILQ